VALAAIPAVLAAHLEELHRSLLAPKLLQPCLLLAALLVQVLPVIPALAAMALVVI
jgi:hypothetical protein